MALACMNLVWRVGLGSP